MKQSRTEVQPHREFVLDDQLLARLQIERSKSSKRTYRLVCLFWQNVRAAGGVEGGFAASVLPAARLPRCTTNNSYCCSQVMWPPNYRPRPPHPQDNHPQQWQLDDDNKDKQATGTTRTRWQNPGLAANVTEFQKFYSSPHYKSHVKTWNINFPYMYKS